MMKSIKIYRLSASGALLPAAGGPRRQVRIGLRNFNGRGLVRPIAILVLLLSPLSAAITIVRVTDVTPTQGILRFVSPACDTASIQVSQSAGLSPLVPDVNPA